ncbi:MAG: putative toxin-antitoxin system toxin component, PIN family [Tepidisphaeraceae bacterium]
MRAVLDTNVLLAGVFTHGVCEAILDECLGNPAHTIIGSEFILREFTRQAASKFGAPTDVVRQTTDLLRSGMELVQPSSVPANSCRDPDDLAILGTLVAGGADCLVTGDRDLLEIKTFRSVPILSPRAFHDRLR